MATITPIRAPVWPPKPDLSDEVEWGPLPTNDAYTLAYRCWECPNDTLCGEEEETEPVDEEGVVMDEEEQKIKKTRKTMEILAYKVYRHLTLNPDEPHDQPAERVQEPPNGGGWPFPRISDELPESQPERTELEGHSIMNQKDRYWTIKKIEEHLQKQQAIPDIRPKKSLEWRQLLHDHVNSVPSVSISTHGLCPRSDLRSWGLQRQNQFIIPPSDGEDRRYNAFELYTWAIHLSPYNPTYWLSRAYLFYQQCLFDLALGDAYRAWYLVGECNRLPVCSVLSPGIISS